MNFLSPRDARGAARTLHGVMLLAAAVLGVYVVLAPPAEGLPLAVGVVVALAVGALALRAGAGRVPGWVFVLVPLLGVGVVAALDLVTSDATTAAQVFFLLPVLFAAAHLQRAAAWAVTAVAVVGEAVTVVTLLPPAVALVDAAFVGSVAVVTTFVLTRANGRTDELVAELRHQAAVDPLTGLVTRRVLDDAAACALGGRDAAEGTALVVLDVDHFKLVNDGHGHPVGDAMLVHVAGLLREAMGPRAVVSRLGGDELAALLPGTSAAAALARAHRLVAAVRARPLVLASGDVPLAVGATVSVGVAHAPAHASDLPGLYRAADGALYAVKEAGRDGAALGPTSAAAAPASPSPSSAGPPSARPDVPGPRRVPPARVGG